MPNADSLPLSLLLSCGLIAACSQQAAADTRPVLDLGGGISMAADGTIRGATALATSDFLAETYQWLPAEAVSLAAPARPAAPEGKGP